MLTHRHVVNMFADLDTIEFSAENYANTKV